MSSHVTADLICQKMAESNRQLLEMIRNAPDMPHPAFALILEAGNVPLARAERADGGGTTTVSEFLDLWQLPAAGPAIRPLAIDLYVL